MDRTPRTATALVVALLAVLLAGKPLSGTVGVESSEPENLAFVTDDDVKYEVPGCDSISVVDVRTGRAVSHGAWRDSPGRLAITAAGDLALSVSNHSGDRLPFLYVLRKRSEDWSRSSTDVLGASRLQHGSSAAIAPDDSNVLLASRYGGVERHSLASLGGRILGPGAAVLSDEVAVEILFGGDPGTAFVADADGYVHIVDVATMTTQGQPIPYQPVGGRVEKKIRNTNGALSPDGRWLVLNTGIGQLTMIDVASRSSRVVDLDGVDETWGVAFNYAASNHGLLAVHGRSAVAVYDIAERESPILVAASQVPAQRFTAWPNHPEWARVASLAWTVSGEGIVAAIRGGREFRVLDLNTRQQPSLLERRLDFDACKSDRNLGMPLDVVTLNDRIRLPSPTPTQGVTPSLTPTLAPTATTTATPRPSDTATATPSLAPSSTATATATTPPAPLYLPLLLGEQCTPDKQRADVALVIDGSSSMLDATSGNRTKLSAAIEAAGVFLDQLQLDAGDQAAVVAFNAEAELVHPLTSDRSELAAALASIEPALKTCLVCGVDVAADELASERRDPDNTPVMIVLTDGLSNPRPASDAVDRAAVAKEAGVVIYTIGLGDTLDFEALGQIASRPEGFHRAPDADDLAEIYRQIAVEIPCPNEEFWGKR